MNRIGIEFFERNSETAEQVMKFSAVEQLHAALGSATARRVGAATKGRKTMIREHSRMIGEHDIAGNPPIAVFTARA